MNLFAFLAFCTFVVGVLAFCVLNFVSRSRVLATRMLSFSLLCLSFGLLQDYLMLSQNILEVPHLYRVGVPLMYLIFPFGYLHVRTMLLREHVLRKTDWLHFLPAMLFFAENVPFYLKSAGYKRQVLEANMVGTQQLTLEAAWLPPYAHIFIILTLGLLYIGLQYKLILRLRKSKHSAYPQAILHWLYTFTNLYAAMIVLHIISNLVGVVFFQANSLPMLVVITSLIVCVIVATLFVHPQVMYGIQWQTKAEDTPMKFTISDEQRLAYRAQIEEYFRLHEPYLKKGYTLENMVSETGIPRHHLSLVINSTFALSFNDLINQYRIQYIKEKVSNEDLRRLTIEGISQLAGFSSRTTFLHSIKKMTGMTPSEFVKKLQQDNDP